MPTTEVTLTQYQKPTPIKAKIQDTINFLKSKVLEYNLCHSTLYDYIRLYFNIYP